jgi:hypothetical protein
VEVELRVDRVGADLPGMERTPDLAEADIVLAPAERAWTVPRRERRPRLARFRLTDEVVSLAAVDQAPIVGSSPERGFRYLHRSIDVSGEVDGSPRSGFLEFVGLKASRSASSVSSDAHSISAAPGADVWWIDEGGSSSARDDLHQGIKGRGPDETDRCGSAVIFLVVGFSVGGAVARPTVETSTATFTLSSATCSNLPSGSTITGAGTEQSITTERTNASGVTTVMNTTHTHGTATDQNLNVYVFDYSNEFRVSNTVATPDLFSGLMTDHFSLSGSGPAKLNNGFVARFTATSGFSSFSFQPIHSHGDPISFPDGAPHCDPLCFLTRPELIRHGGRPSVGRCVSQPLVALGLPAKWQVRETLCARGEGGMTQRRKVWLLLGVTLVVVVVIIWLFVVPASTRCTLTGGIWNGAACLH